MRLAIFHQLLLALLVFLPVKALMASDDNVVITAEEIATLQAHSMADILNTVPGLSAGTSSVSIHGNLRVKVLFDGRPLNDPTSSYGGINWEMVNLSDITRIEILRGKGSVKYGQDTSGGVILISSKGKSAMRAHLKTFGGSQDRYYVRSNVQAASGPWQAAINGGYETTNGYVVNNDKKRYQLGALVGYSFHDEADISFSADFSEDKRGYAGYPEFPTPFSRGETRMTIYTLQANLHEVSSKTYLNQGEKTNSDISKNLLRTIEVDEFGQELDSYYTTKRFGTLNYGGAFYYDTASGNSFEDQDETTTSLFLIDSYSLQSYPVNISMGFRANLNSAFDNAYNPEVKLTYTAENWKTTLGVNRSNNSPSFYHRYNETSTKRPNPDLDMETSDNYSVALFSTLEKPVNGSITLFHNRLNDRITYIYDDLGTGQYQNIGSATYTGGDLSLDWEVCKNFQCKINYTYLVAKDKETDLDLPSKSRHKGRISLTYKPINPLSIILLGKGSSSVYRNKANTATVAGYFTADFKMEYSFKTFSLFSEVTNILDKDYLYVDGLQAPPRAWFAGVTLRI